MSFAFPSRLYAILDVDSVAASGSTPTAVLDIWLEHGVRLLQLRAKSLASGDMLALVERMAPRCRAVGAMLFVNDRADVAAMAGVPGVHVGQDDLPPAAVRDIVGPRSVIGLSTHTAAQLMAATRDPVDYLAIGPVFSTSTKVSGHAAVGLDGVREAARLARAAGRPLVAIGGITLSSAPEVLAAGADAIAVISDLLVDVPGERARAYLSAVA